MIQLFRWKLVTEVGVKCLWTAKYPWKFQNMTGVEWEDFCSAPCFQAYISGRMVLCQEATSNTDFCTAVFTGKQGYSSQRAPPVWGWWNLLNLTFVPASIRWTTPPRICSPLLIQRKQKTKDPLSLCRWRSWWLQGNGLKPPYHKQQQATLAFDVCAHPKSS